MKYLGHFTYVRVIPTEKCCDDVTGVSALCGTRSNKHKNGYWTPSLFGYGGESCGENSVTFSEFQDWEFSTVSPKSDGEIRNLYGISSAGKREGVYWNISGVGILAGGLSGAAVPR